MPKYKFSIIIPTYRRQKRLQALLDSLCVQTLPIKEWEAVVVDDRSQEDFTQILQKYSNRINISVIVSEVKGRPGARNTGAAAARGDLLIFVDDDMELEPGFIEGHLKIHRKWPDCVASGRILPAQDTGTLWNILLDERFALHEKHVAKSPEDLGFTCVFTGNFSVRRSTFWKVGGFDDVTFSYYAGEDFDFGVRCRNAGIKIVYADFAVTKHFETNLSRKHFLEKNRWAAVSMIVLLNKYKNLVIEDPALIGFPCSLPGIYKPKRKWWKAILREVLLVPPFLEVGLWTAESLWFCLNQNLVLKIARICSTFYYQRYLRKATRLIWQKPRIET